MLTRAPAGRRVVRTGTLRFVGLAAVTAVVGGGCTGSGPDSPPGSPPDGAAVALVAFDSCAGALRELTRAAAPFVGPYGLAGSGHSRPDVAVSAREDSAGAGAAAAPTAPTTPTTPRHSTTNTHEAGVDEPDLVKTDGRRLVTVVGGRLRVVDLASRRVTASLGLPDGPAEHLLLHGDRALVVVPHSADTWRSSPVEPPVRPDGARFVLVDLTGAGRVLDTLTVDGSYVDARQVGGVARVVVRSGPRLRFAHPDGRRSSSEARQQNLRVVAESSIDDWLPRYELRRAGERRQGRLVDCERVSRPATYSASSMLTVLTLDLGGLLGTGDPVTVVADGDTVYGTASSLYVAAHQRFAGPQPGGGPDPGWDQAPLPRSQPQRTEVHKFDTSAPGRPRYVASGSVQGSLLNQYSLSEHDGRLRVATTLDPGAGRCCDEQSRSESAVSVLAQRGNRLVQVGRVDGLGKGERIYAVRFLGPVGYVVTFRQTDPLYTLDLSDPTRPRAVGELKITGYSAYLHPTGEDSLLGVGQEATGEGRRLGTQVSLFDVGDPARPRRTAQHHLRYGQSEVEFDPHAFLYWQASGLVVLPVTMPARPVPDADRDRPATAVAGALVLRLHDGTLAQLGVVRHPAGADPGGGMIRRSLVVGDTLWTVSDAGAKAVSGTDLAARAWVPFT
jgi:Beta propeller domain